MTDVVTQTGEQSVPRIGARVLLLDRAHCVLLIHERIEGGAHWLTPGGGVEPGETLREAAARELYEETGIQLDLDGATEPVHRQQRSWSWAGTTYDQTDHFYLARIGIRPPIAPAALTSMEHQTLIGHHWWSAAELRAAAGTDTFEPPELADILERLAATSPALPTDA